MKQDIIDHFKAQDPVLFDLIGKVDPFELTSTNDFFLELCDDIISQQLSIKASATILTRFINLFPHQLVTPETLLEIDDEAIRAAGISYSKIQYLKDLAQKVKDKEIHLDKLKDMSDEEVIQELIKVKGIGKWTAEMFLMSALGREDVFSYGDLGLRRAIQRLYNLPQEPTQEEAEEIAKRWMPYRTYACKILWRSLALK